ncbi:MAG: YgiT-type zinc finger protein [bacterium]
MSQKCNFCGNKKFRKTDVQYLYKHDGKFLFVNNVPCEECEYCGEQYFEAKVLKKIENYFKEIYDLGKKAKMEIQVPVEEFWEI